MVKKVSRKQSFDKIRDALEFIDEVLVEDEQIPCFPELVKAVTYLEEALEKING